VSQPDPAGESPVTTAKPLARYSAVEDALASGFATAELHHQRGHDRYYAFPDIHWHKLRTNNPLERIMREIRRRTRVVGAFPDGQAALNLAAARLRHVAGTAWSTKQYLNMELLKDQHMKGAITA
jgi:putative transposase